MLPVDFGLGGVPLGNEFEVVSDEGAHKTLEAAWNAGVRYYDVSPWYGLGLGERRYEFATLFSGANKTGQTGLGRPPPVMRSMGNARLSGWRQRHRFLT